MSHKVLIAGTSYAIKGGTDLIAGTSYQIGGGVERWWMVRSMR